MAQAADREYDGWFGGRVLPLAGVADVTVAAEAPGPGACSARCCGRCSRAPADRGAVVSTLFPTAPRIYRRAGYESVATMRWVDVPSAALSALRAGTRGRAAPGRVRRTPGPSARSTTGGRPAWTAR